MQGLTLCWFSIFLIMTAFAHCDSIIPGKAAGRIKLGVTRKAVHAILGEPQSSRTATGEQVVSRDVWKSPAGNFLFVYYRGENVVQVNITSSALKTPKGLAVGKSLAEAKKKFGELKKFSCTSDEGGAAYFWYDASDPGIAFCVTPFEGHSAEKITAIAIHLPGEAVVIY